MHGTSNNLHALNKPIFWNGWVSFEAARAASVGGQPSQSESSSSKVQITFGNAAARPRRSHLMMSPRRGFRQFWLRRPFSSAAAMEVLARAARILSAQALHPRTHAWKVQT